MADLDEEAAPPPLRKRKAPTKVAFEVGESFRKMRTAEVLKIISKVQENSILWDQTHADYKEVEKKNRIWWDAERELGFLKVNRGSTLRKIWAQLSAEFRRERDRQKKTSGDDGDDVIAEFEYYNLPLYRLPLDHPPHPLNPPAPV